MPVVRPRDWLVIAVLLVGLGLTVLGLSGVHLSSKTIHAECYDLTPLGAECVVIQGQIEEER